MSLLLALAAICTPATATATTIEAIQADYTAWEGKCVRVRGIGSGIELMSDRMAVLEDRGPYGRDAKHSIILLPHGGHRLSLTPALIEATGVVQSCRTANDAIAAAQAENPGEILMVGGYCHTSLETYLNVASVRTVSRAPIPRLTEADVPAGQRSLVELPSEFAKRREPHDAAARQMLTALATRDETGFRRLASPDAQNEIDTRGMAGIGDGTRDQVRTAHRDWLAALALQGAARAILRRGEQPHWLIDRTSIADLSEEGEDMPYLLACWCKLGDCSGKWPIAAGDADNRAERPYLCVRAEGGYVLDDGRTVIQIIVAAGREPGFAEPKWEVGG